MESTQEKAKTHTSRSIDYKFSSIEQAWQAYWEQNQTFKADNDSNRPKYYALDMFPYPSGAGLHVGHPEGYTATDILSRYKKANGFNVLHPMGWDAFGLPAEQHAIATGTPPASNTAENIRNFKRQLKSFGFGIDWSREVNTTDPHFFKWTQWIFLQLFKKGLAYVDERPVWWCPALGTVLANEEVIDGKSERGSHPVERRNLRQWVLKITAYADKLLEGLEDLDWPDSTKRQQIAWIGKSEGAHVHFNIDGHPSKQLTVFTTRIDTLNGATFMVIAPEHPLLGELTTPDNKEQVTAYITKAKSKSDLERTDLAKHKTGEFTGSYVINPLNGEKMPIWVADYVLISYGTGAVMAVPGHDERDNEFAHKFDLQIKEVIQPMNGEKRHSETLFAGEGKLINSGEFNGLLTDEAKVKITEHLNKKNHAETTTQYKLRDWLFSRQRYWGEPFPIVWVSENDFNQFKTTANSPLHAYQPKEPVTYHQSGETFFAIALPENALPLQLPEVASYQPSGDAESPLANATDWVNVCINFETGEIVSQSKQQAGGTWVTGKRETNTMPQWAGSCWYYLRYLDPSNDSRLIDPEIEKYWGCPDIYIGGAEHAVLHLLYARFWHKVLFDLGVVTTSEPFKKLIHQGIILGEMEYTLFEKDDQPISAKLVENGYIKETNEPVAHKNLTSSDVEKKGDAFVLKSNPDIQVDARAFKMSKSRGNVVNPDDIIEQYGADTFRLYEMFLGPLEAMKPWSSQGMEGIARFLRKIWREYVSSEGHMHEKIQRQVEETPDTLKALHETIKKVTEDIEDLSYNTAISQMMIFVNHLQKTKSFTHETSKAFLQLLAPFAPHITEELWTRIGEEPSISDAPWPKYNAQYLVQNTVKVAVQVNGKLRAEIEVEKDADKEIVLTLAKEQEKVKAHIDGKTLIKEIYVPGKIVNLVVK